MKKIASYTVYLVFILSFVLLAACNSEEAAEPTAKPVELQTVRVQLLWDHGPTTASYYMANDKGYYAEEGLKIEISTAFAEDGSIIDVADKLDSGEAEIGNMDAGGLLLAREKGLPLVAFGTIFQRHPFVLVSLTDSNIVRPEDMVGKTVHISDPDIAMYQALLESEGIDPESIDFHVRTDYSNDLLTTGQADVFDAWISTEVVALRDAGHEVNIIYPFDYGVDMYPILLVTSEKLMADNPEMIQRFLRATLKGMRDVIADPRHAAELVAAQLSGESDIDLLEESIRQGIPLLNPPGSELGMMTAEKWDLSYRILREQGVLSQDIDDLSTAYTLRFLDAIYTP